MKVVKLQVLLSNHQATPLCTRGTIGDHGSVVEEGHLLRA